MSTFIDFHALQTVPPSNLNRDDTGAPKTATYGGVVRHRVSSQSWKRAIRDDFEGQLDKDKLGIRTKKVIQHIADTVVEIDPNWERSKAVDAAVHIFSRGGITVQKPKTKKGEPEAEPETQSLFFLSNNQKINIAHHIIETDGAEVTRKEAAELLDQNHGFEVAMFGRMVADAKNYNVEAAVQVAHALGISPAEVEFDFYTGRDELAENSAAAMMGIQQMVSSTLYRYATVNYQQLVGNLSSAEAAVEAVGAFARSFTTSMPTGKQASYANRTMPEAVVISIRDDRPISLVTAFEDPVEASEKTTRRVEAGHRLASELSDIDSTYGTAPVKTWVVALKDLREVLSDVGQTVSLPTMLDELEAELSGEES